MISQKITEKLLEVTNWQFFQAHLTCDNGKTKYAHFAKRPDTVMLFAIFPNGKFFVIKEHCPARDAYEYFLPKGKIKEGEPLKLTAERELQEEVGFNAKNCEEIGILTNDKMQTDTHVILMRDLFESRLEGDELERAEVRQITFTEFETLVKNGDFKDARSIAAVYLAQKFL